jgi:hypothetical protein
VCNNVVVHSTEEVMRAVFLALAALALTGCDPNWIETSAEVDMFISQARWSAVCVALKNDRDDKLREYAANKLAEQADNPVATECVCNAVTDWKHGPYDAAVAQGLQGSNRDDLVPCLTKALPVVKDEERTRLVAQIAGLGAPAGYAKTAELVRDHNETVATRVAAVAGLLPARDEYTELLLQVVASDPDPTVRAEAVLLFENVTDKKVVDALLVAAKGDADGGVRAAALKAVVKLKLEETDALVCDMMMNDPDERVRDRAVRSFKGSKRREALDCLQKRLLTREESDTVRESTMKAIYASPDPYAPKILCDAIGPFVRMNVGELPVHKMSGADIVKHQNNRDYENSLECVQRALRQGGYSCWGRWYLAQWTVDLGGKAFRPTCKGMDPPEVITFE